MALLASQRPALTGLATAYAAASAGGDTFTPEERLELRVKNGSGAAITVTVDSKPPCNFGEDHNLVISVPAGGERAIEPLSPARFADASGVGSVTYSAVTSLTIGAFAH